MSTERAGSRTAWVSFAVVLAGAGRPSARANTLVDGWPVWMNGSQARPAWEVHAVSQAAEGIEPSRTPRLRARSTDAEVAGTGRTGRHAVVRRRGRARQSVLHLSTWPVGKAKNRFRGARRGRMRTSQKRCPGHRLIAKQPGARGDWGEVRAWMRSGKTGSSASTRLDSGVINCGLGWVKKILVFKDLNFLVPFRDLIFIHPGSCHFRQLFQPS